MVGSTRQFKFKVEFDRGGGDALVATMRNNCYVEMKLGRKKLKDFLLIGFYMSDCVSSRG